MARRNDPISDPAVRDLKKLMPDAGAVVEMPLAQLHEADDLIDHAVSYLADFIEKRMQEQGFESWDEANERSPDLSELMFLLSLIEDAGFVTERHVKQSLVRGDLQPQ